MYDARALPINEEVEDDIRRERQRKHAQQRPGHIKEGEEKEKNVTTKSNNFRISPSSRKLVDGIGRWLNGLLGCTDGALPLARREDFVDGVYEHFGEDP